MSSFTESGLPSLLSKVSQGAGERSHCLRTLTISLRRRGFSSHPPLEWLTTAFNSSCRWSDPLLISMLLCACGPYKTVFCECLRLLRMAEATLRKSHHSTQLTKCRLNRGSTTDMFMWMGETRSEPCPMEYQQLRNDECLKNSLFWGRVHLLVIQFQVALIAYIQVALYRIRRAYLCIQKYTHRHKHRHNDNNN